MSHRSDVARRWVELFLFALCLGLLLMAAGIGEVPSLVVMIPAVIAYSWLRHP